MSRQVLTIKAGDDVLHRFSNGLGALGKDRTQKVLARALNRTGGPTLTKVRRVLAARTSTPMSIIRRQVYAQKAWAGAVGGEGKLDFKIIAYGRPLPLAVFKPTEFKFGVRAKVWGRVQRFEGAFMRGGRWPNRVELNMGTGQVYVRSTKSRTPIERVYGPSLPKELVEEEVFDAFEANVARLGDDIAHELDRELSKFD